MSVEVMTRADLVAQQLPGRQPPVVREQARDRVDIRLFNDTPADEQAWEAYVARSPQATSDHRWGWRRVLGKAFGFAPHFLAAVEQERVVGILPLFEVPRGFRRVALVSIPFGNYGGICADAPAAAAALLAAAKDLLAERRGECLELRHRVPVAEETLQLQPLYHRFSLPIDGGPEAMFQAMSSNKRRQVRRAIGGGLRVIVSRDVGPLYPIHVHTSRRLGTPCFPRRYFEEILREFGDTATILFVIKADRPIAFDVLLPFKDSLVCQFSGSLTPFFSFYPNDFLFWCAIQHGYALGLHEIDYCRSRTDSGSAAFKRQLRMREEPLAYQYYLPHGQPVPQRNPSNPKYRLAIRAWQRLPLGLTRALGPAIVRYLA